MACYSSFYSPLYRVAVTGGQENRAAPMVPQIRGNSFAGRPEASGHRRDIPALFMYYSTYVPLDRRLDMVEIERVQTGIRIEKRLLKVLKALAELKDLSLGDLLEGIVLHAFEGKAAFSKETLGQIVELKKIYHLSLRAANSHKLKDRAA
jgi:hypothetical protein